MIDSGRLVQLATPAELLARPANVMVAALTGANILEGTATLTPSDDRAPPRRRRAHSAAPASGAVHIAIHPWHFKLTDPNACGLTDTVLSVRHDRGALTVRLSRFTIKRRPAITVIPRSAKARSSASAPTPKTYTSCARRREHRGQAA